MKTAVTLSQVAEAAAGPFVFRQPLPEAFAIAAEIGFDAVELFLPSADFVSVEEIRTVAEQHGLSIAAVGTGAGMLRHGLSLTDPSAEKRQAALDFILALVDFGGQLGAPAILGSMQGKWGGEVNREQALDWLAESLHTIGQAAAKHAVPFLYEPLNRYETNLINRIGQGADFLISNGIENVLLLADLFHMNIEEANPSTALYHAQSHVGHVHWADSNRQAIGFGHTDTTSIVGALREIGYTGYLSAEILPLPDPETAARQTLTSIRSFLS
ncbi:MAG: sugar phosphate isomerase/epimerase family protein [Verrucomicrobiales bacterium]